MKQLREASGGGTMVVGMWRGLVAIRVFSIVACLTIVGCDSAEVLFIVYVVDAIN